MPVILEEVSLGEWQFGVGPKEPKFGDDEATTCRGCGQEHEPFSSERVYCHMCTETYCSTCKHQNNFVAESKAWRGEQGLGAEAKHMWGYWNYWVDPGVGEAWFSPWAPPDPGEAVAEFLLPETPASPTAYCNLRDLVRECPRVRVVHFRPGCTWKAGTIPAGAGAPEEEELGPRSSTSAFPRPFPRGGGGEEEEEERAGATGELGEEEEEPHEPGSSMSVSAIHRPIGGRIEYAAG